MPAKKSAAKSSPKVVKKAAAKPAVVAKTAVRNSPIPKAVAARVITNEMIAIRAYEISQSPACGSQDDNWLRAERELRGL